MTAVLRDVREAVSANKELVNGQFTGRHALISIVDSKRHFWSPWLSLEVADDNQGCEISGRFSPHPSVWTAFIFAYLSLAVLSFFSVIFGMSQQLVGQTPWGYWLLLVFVVLGISLWSASQVGQKLADADMRKLKSIVSNCVPLSSEIR
jgi:hypothetical protein